MDSKIATFALEARKFLAAAGSVVVLLIAQGVLSGSAAFWVQLIIGAAGAALVYFLPNEKPAEPVEKEEVDPETGLPFPTAE